MTLIIAAADAAAFFRRAFARFCIHYALSLISFELRHYFHCRWQAFHYAIELSLRH